MRKKKVTISDIAEKTGYSKTTVSFAFNWPNRISAETVERIMKCADEMGYKGSSQLSDDERYKNICLFIPNIEGMKSFPVWIGATLELYKQCAPKDFMLSFISEQRMDDQFFARTCAVDAFLVFCPIKLDESFMSVIRKRRIPIIGINLNVTGDTEEERYKKRRANAAVCVNLMFDAIDGKEIDVSKPNDAYGFISLNS